MQIDDWLLTPQRAAVHRPTATAVIADLHLGYEQVRQRGGEAVPIVGVQACLATLRRLVAMRDVRRLIIAGDLFEDGRRNPPAREFLAGLADLRLELHGVIPGNHDRGLAKLALPLPIYPEGLCLGDWRIVHGDGALPKGKVVHGHCHPCLRWGNRQAAACYLISKRRLVLPAFSADAAGVNVLGVQSWAAYRCVAIGGNELLDFGVLGEHQAFSRNRRESRGAPFGRG